VTTGPRIGLNNVPEPWKSIPWRFRIQPEHITECTEKTTREEQGGECVGVAHTHTFRSSSRS
jgi:hypothetical protein